MIVNITTKMSVIIPDTVINTHKVGSYIEELVEHIGDTHNVDIYEWWEN